MKAACASVTAVLMLAGCAGLTHQGTPTVGLALEPAPLGGGLLAGGPTIAVGRFATAGLFATERLAVRDAAGRWTFANYHRWLAEPGVMVSSRLREALSRSDLFGAVFTPPAPLEADYRLSGAVRALYWDREARSAALEVEVCLVAARDRLAGFWVHRTVVPVGGDTAAEFVAAGSAAQAEVFAKIQADLAAALAAPAAAAGAPK